MTRAEGAVFVAWLSGALVSGVWWVQIASVGLLLLGVWMARPQRDRPARGGA